MAHISTHGDSDIRCAACKLPNWTFLIPSGSHRKCRVCNTSYRLDKEEWAMDCVFVQWIEVVKQP